MSFAFPANINVYNVLTKHSYTGKSFENKRSNIFSWNVMAYMGK